MPALNTLTLFSAKELATTYRPTVLVSIALVNGPTIYLCSASQETTEGIVWTDGNTYLPRLAQQQADQLQEMSPQGIDVTGQYTLRIADADFFCMELESSYGFASALMTCTLVMYDPETSQFSTDSSVRFAGQCNGGTRSAGLMSVNAIGTFDLRMKQFPDRPIQSTCTWTFPPDAPSRGSALSDPFSIFYSCGYSPDLGGGMGNYQSGSTPFTSCPKDKTSCQARGMYSRDSSNRYTSTFGGEQWLPPATWKGAQYVSGKTTQGINTANIAKYSDYFPETFGTTWSSAIALNVVGDPNSTRGEFAVANGYMNGQPANDLIGTGLITVVVNGVLIPWSTQTNDLLLRVYTLGDGSRQGFLNTTAIYNGQGDPHGGTCVIMPIVYQQIQSSTSVPNVQVLCGPKQLPVFSSQTSWSWQRTDNPAWVLIEIYRRAGIQHSAWDMNSVIACAAVCAGSVSYTNQYGAAATHRRYGVSLTLQKPQSVATVSEGLRTANRIMVVPNATGTLLQMVSKETLCAQQPSPVAGSNDNTPYASFAITDNPLGAPSGTGYVAYHFDETTILDGLLSFLQAKVSDSANVLVANIQDEDNYWTQDTVTLDDDVALNRVGHRVQSTFAAIGLPNYEQAYRALQTKQFELYRGNPRGDSGGTWQFQFDSSVRVAHLNQGMIVSLSLFGYGLTKQLFRVIGCTPKADYETSTVKLQYHDDRAYTDGYGQKASPYFSNAGELNALRPPFGWQAGAALNVAADPLYGNNVAGTYATFRLDTGADLLQDGTVETEAEITGYLPINQPVNRTAPRLALQGTYSPSGGNLPGGYTWYVYASALDAGGNEGPLCALPCLVYAPGSGATNSLTIPVFGWPVGTTGYRLYMGSVPTQIALCASGSGIPSSVSITSYVATGRGSVDTVFDHFVVRIKRVTSPGWMLLGPGWLQSSAAGLNAVTSNTITFPSALILPTGEVSVGLPDGQLNQYSISAVCASGGGQVPFVNLKVVSQAGNTVTIDMSLGSVDLTTLGLTNVWFLVNHYVWSAVGPTIVSANASFGDGAALVGLQMRVVAGTGVTNAPRPIIAGYPGIVVLDVAPPIPLDNTSVVIIEETSWYTETPQSPVVNGLANATTTLKAQFSNLNTQGYYCQVASMDANGNEGITVAEPGRLFVWLGDAGGVSNQGLNLIPNGDFEYAAPGGSSDPVANWYIQSNSITGGWAAFQHAGTSYSGNNSLGLQFIGVNGVLTTAFPGWVAAITVSSRNNYPIPKPSEQYYLSAYMQASIQSGSLPSGIQLVWTAQVGAAYSDNSSDSSTAAFPGEITTFNAWINNTGRLTVDPSKTPTSLFVNLSVYLLNTNPYDTTLPTGLAVLVDIDHVSVIRMVDGNNEVIGLNGHALLGRMAGLYRRWVVSDVENGVPAIQKYMDDSQIIAPYRWNSHLIAKCVFEPDQLAKAQEDSKLIVLPSLHSGSPIPEPVAKLMAPFAVAPDMTMHDMLQALAKATGETRFLPEE